MSEKYAALRQEILNPAIGSRDHLRKIALQLLDEIAEREAEREADKARIAELTGKPPEDYPDDSELCFVIDECDCLADYQTAQWLKELRRRRAAGITLETGERS